MLICIIYQIKQRHLHKWGNMKFPIAREGGREVLSLMECMVLLILWFIILSCLGHCNKRPSHNILLSRSIVQAIRLHVSEVPCSGAVSAHTTCVPCPSPTEPHSGPPLTTKPGHAKRTTQSAARSDHQTRSGMVQTTQCGYTFRKESHNLIDIL